MKALACELPANSGCAAGQVELPGPGCRGRHGAASSTSVSASTVRRWLAADALKPWQHRSWIFPRDPDFAVKAARVLDLYARVFDGEPLGENDYVLSADEKPGVQARSRIHPQPHRPDRAGGRCASKANTDATARWPTWPPMTCTAPT